ncbi:MAG: alpha-glucan family phosphorylase, partial [Nanoarchaeota archaeon]|nr:alpha-glucan family phosphorylase [Nanoarchaeota archaeon]
NEFDANINGRLYPGKGKEENRHLHIAQEVLLGIGGIRMLEEQGYHSIERIHLNEGHAALAPLELMHKMAEQATRDMTVYTTHTPVPAGIDAFDAGDAHYILPKTFGDGREIGRLTHSSGLHMMKLAMALSGKSNAVSELHRDVSQALFSDFPNMSNLRYVDNGVHLPTWTAPNIQVLYDRISPGWREHPRTLETALLDLTPEEVLGAHAIPKARLGEFIDDNLGHRVRGYNHFDPEKLTIGFARRFATYKQANLVFEHLDRVKELGKDVQIVFAGKAHPTDDGGKGVIKDVFKYMKELQEHMSIWFIEDYDMDMARFMVQGVDVWLNTPQQYEEASGTSGMKAAINFVPQLSIIDGWWTRDQQREGYRHPKGLVEGVTGWGIGNDPSMEHFKRVNADWSLRERMRVDNARDLIEKIGGVIVPLFKGDKKGWADVGKHAAALNGSYYNSHRMLDEYWKLYDLGHGL